MKVLVISHTYCEWASRAKWRVLAAQYQPLQLRVITPLSWPTIKESVISRPESDQSLVVAPQYAYWTGDEACHWFPRLFKEIYTFQPDIIHVETGSISLTLLQSLMTLPLLKKKPRILFFTWVNWLQKFTGRARIYNVIERFNLHGVDGAIFGNNDAQYLFTTQKKFSGKSVVIPQIGTDPQVFAPALELEAARRAYDITNPQTFVIGFAGRLVPEKGVQDLLNALTLLPLEIQKNIEVLLAGGGAYESELRRLAAQQGAARIRFVGPLTHAQMPNFFKALDLFVLPSFDIPTWKEQFGQVLVQAMLTKVGVVASTGGEIPHVVGDTGLIFTQRNIQQLAEHLERMYRQPELRKAYAQKGYERAQLLFSDAAIARRTYQFWNELLETR